MKTHVVLLGLLSGSLVWGQQLHMTPAGLWFTSVPGTTYTLLSAPRPDGPWVQQAIITATGTVARQSVSMTAPLRFYKLRPPQDIKLLSDTNVELFIVLDFVLPITNGGWKVIVRTNNTPFITMNGTIRTNRMYLIDPDPLRSGYPGLSGFEVEVWVTNSTIRQTNRFNLVNHYRPSQRSRFESSVVEDSGVITATLRSQADAVMETALASLTQEWKYFSVRSQSFRLDPDNWDVLETSAHHEAFTNYLGGGRTNYPTHLFYMGDVSSLHIPRRLAFTFLIASNAHTIGEQAGGPSYTADELYARGKYGGCAVWIEPVFQDGDLSEQFADGILRFISLAADFGQGIRRYTIRQVLEKMADEYPELIFHHAGSIDSDLDGWY